MVERKWHLFQIDFLNWIPSMACFVFLLGMADALGMPILYQLTGKGPIGNILLPSRKGKYPIANTPLPPGVTRWTPAIVRPTNAHKLLDIFLIPIFHDPNARVTKLSCMSKQFQIDLEKCFVHFQSRTTNKGKAYLQFLQSIYSF